jgi:hypothetical protein
MFFWEESQEGGVHCSTQFFGFVSEVEHSGEIFLNDVLTFFVEMKSETVWARGFVILELV